MTEILEHIFKFFKQIILLNVHKRSPSSAVRVEWISYGFTGDTHPQAHSQDIDSTKL